MAKTRGTARSERAAAYERLAARIGGSRPLTHHEHAEAFARPGLPTDYAARKALPLFEFLTGYFPLAVAEVVKVAVVGNEQHNPGQPLHWAREKSTDQLNTAMRHQFDHGMGAVFDETDDGRVPGMRTMHLAKAVWRLMAEIQLLCEASATEAPSDGWANASKAVRP